MKIEVLRILIDKQLEPHGVTFDDVKKEPEWFLKYTTTPQKNQEWIDWGIEIIRKKLNISKTAAKQAMQWVNLSYGLKEVEDATQAI